MVLSNSTAFVEHCMLGLIQEIEKLYEITKTADDYVGGQRHLFE